MAPTVVTAVAEATANPRTEIRLTRNPSSVARTGDPRGRNRAPGARLPTTGSREALTRWATPFRERRVVLGRHTAALLSYVDTAMPYAGPDENQTLPEPDTARQFHVTWDRSHPIRTRSFDKPRARHSTARLGSFALPGGTNYP
ncbi:hypothetical protein GCM10020367_40940 [Streptomyces sannanensis]|uniref:Uncharacterized protein n=1 Tax=Streptomyces sannanensis TaxID=285536 RepID=A0ABP6SF20_9ACTN